MKSFNYSRISSRLLCILAMVFYTVLSFGQNPASKEIQYLSGTDAVNTKTWEFLVTSGRNSGQWTDIQVPSHWEQQGFGSYNYGRDNVTFGKNFKYADETGLYRYSFDVSPNWQGKEVYIVFEGSMTDTEVRINGQLAGPIHQGAFYRFKYNIGSKLLYGQPNTLDVKVSKRSKNNSVNGAERAADYWIFGGIYRPVYLEAVPTESIDWMAIDAKADGTFTMDVHLLHPVDGRSIVAELVDQQGKVAGTARGRVSRGDTVVRLHTSVTKPKRWTAETPHLYEVRVRLTDGKNSLYQTSDKFGFRTIEVRKGDGIYVNGVKIKFKGVNRHVFWPEYGRTTFPDADVKDVQLIKEMNMNAVRCAHYPPDKNFLRVCDSLGLYVVNELAGWQTAYSTAAGTPLVREMVIRDVNHPSVLFWSNGNEGGHNKNLVALYHEFDISKRPVIHAHHRPGNAINGIDCNHYEDYYSTKRILQDSLIYMPTEFLHAMHDGGAAAAMADFWELHWHSKVGAGGFIWNLADEAIMLTDQGNRLDANGYNGPDGVAGPHRQKEGSAYALREIYSPIKIDIKELSQDFDGYIPVENRYHFTNIKDCRFEAELLNFNNMLSGVDGHETKEKWTVASADILPHQTGRLNLELPVHWRQYDALSLRAYDQHGQEVYTWVWQVKSNRQIWDEWQSAHAVSVRETATCTEEDGILKVKGGGITAHIAQETGLLVGIENDKTRGLSFRNGPVLLQGESHFVGIKHYPEGDSYVVEADYSGNLKQIKWTMHPNGWLELTYSYHIQGSYPYTGVSFDYPESIVTSSRWLGKGPSRVWKNRLQGGRLDVHSNAYNDTDTGREPWIYPEFKGYFSDVVWMEFQTMEGGFTVFSPDQSLFVRRFEFYGMYGAVRQPLLPGGDISFLDAIPPIGTNTKSGLSTDQRSYGPLSELNHIDKPVQRTLYFYFGLLPSPK